jgi:hypothetical protein
VGRFNRLHDQAGLRHWGSGLPGAACQRWVGIGDRGVFARAQQDLGVRAFHEPVGQPVLEGRVDRRSVFGDVGGR